MPTIATRILEARGAYDQEFNKQALRDPRLGLLNIAKRSNLLNNINSNLLEQSWNKPSLKIPVMNRITPTVVNGIADCAMGDLENDTAMVTPTFVNKHVFISFFDNEADNNELSAAQLLAQKLMSAEQQLAEAFEAEFYNLLDANKATTYNSGLVGAGGFYPLAGDALQVSGQPNQDRFFYDFPAILQSDDFDSMNLDVVASPEIGRWLNYNSNQGQANNQNLASQFNSYDYEISRFITKTAAVNAYATGFIMPKNSIGYYGRVGGSYAKNSRIGEVREWGTMQSAKLGIDLMIGSLKECGDASVISGNALDVSSLKEQWVIQASASFLTPYTGGRTNSGIKKFDYIP